MLKYRKASFSKVCQPLGNIFPLVEEKVAVANRGRCKSEVYYRLSLDADGDVSTAYR